MPRPQTIGELAIVVETIRECTEEIRTELCGKDGIKTRLTRVETWVKPRRCVERWFLVAFVAAIGTLVGGAVATRLWREIAAGPPIVNAAETTDGNSADGPN